MSKQDRFSDVLTVQFTPEQRAQIREVAQESSSFEAQVVRQAWNFFYASVLRNRKRAVPSAEAEAEGSP